jgi:hypothetical protein
MPSIPYIGDKATFSGGYQLDVVAAMKTEFNLADDIMFGGSVIAEFLTGRSDQKAMRKLYHLASEVPEADRLPVFRLGGQLCARKTTLLNWIAERERSARGA